MSSRPLFLEALKLPLLKTSSPHFLFSFFKPSPIALFTLPVVFPFPALFRSSLCSAEDIQCEEVVRSGDAEEPVVWVFDVPSSSLREKTRRPEKIKGLEREDAAAGED